jgi:hypothetical protein
MSKEETIELLCWACVSLTFFVIAMYDLKLYQRIKRMNSRQVSTRKNLPDEKLIPLEAVEEIKSRRLTPEDTVFVHWLCDSYATVLTQLQDSQESR